MRSSANRSTIVSCLLGFAALTANLAGHEVSLAPGAVFIFVAAIGFGLEGAVCAAIIGAIPLTLLDGGFFTAVRLALLGCVVGAWQYYGWRRPAVVAVALAWNSALLLALAIGSFAPSLEGLVWLEASRAELLKYLLNDFVAVTIASAFLATDAGWYSLVRRSRSPSTTNYIILLITASTLLTLAACAFAGWSIATSVDGALLIVGLASAAAFLPTILFHYFPKIPEMLRENQRSSTLSLSSQRQLGFSGESAMFWRNKESSATSMFERSGTSTELSSTGISQIGFGADIGVCILDSTGAVTLANRQFKKLTNFADREITGKPFAQCALTPEISRTFTDLVMHPSPLKRTREVRLSHAGQNADRFFELSVIPSELAPGSLQGEPGTVVLTIREVTDLRAIEMRLLQSQKLASLGSVVTGIGHAFNSALTTIIGRASHARLVTDPKVVSDGLNAIIEEAQRAGVFVNKLLDFATDSPRAKAVFDARHFITERKELFTNVLGTEHGLEINLPERALGVACDPNLLTQALTNLFLNAREAMSTKTGRVTLSLGIETIDPDVALLNVSAYPGTFVRIRVSDTGHGMNSAVLSHACEPSFTTRSAGGHSGLGLPTAFAVARAHDGFLTIESTPARGTHISLYLPEVALSHTAQGDIKAAALPHQPATSLTSPNAPRVLVVEDEPTIRELVAGMLTSLGATVTSCEKPQEALVLAKDKSFDVAFVDLIMPTMGGNEWVSHLRSQQRGDPTALPVVLMTGHGASGEHEKSIHSVLPKPFTLEDLKAALESAARPK